MQDKFMSLISESYGLLRIQAVFTVRHVVLFAVLLSFAKANHKR